ncbi:MAG: MFS transporter, partial [Dehalococcoidia bacterium]
MKAARLPFYYGWIVVAGGAFHASFVLGSSHFALSAFLVPMEDELGWSTTLLFGALSLRQLLAALLGPIAGPLADRVGAPRIAFPVGVLLLGASLAAVRWTDHPVWFFFWYGGVGAVASSLVHLTMWEAVVLKWFSRRRARALLWTSVGEASGPMVFPVLITLLIALYGWRDAWLWYGVLTTATLLPFTLVLRTRPEQVGQHLDGDATPVRPERPEAQVGAEQAVVQAASTDAGLTRNEALRTRSFWLVAAAFTLTGIGVSGFQSHWIPHFRELGFGAGVAAAAVSVYGASNIGSRILWGTLAARFPIRWLLTVHTAAAGAGVLFLLTLVNSSVTLFCWAIYQGLVLGSFFQLHALLSAEYFGRAHTGAIRGAMLPLASTTRGTGALLVGALRDWRGSYTLAFLLVFGTWMVNSVLVAV